MSLIVLALLFVVLSWSCLSAVDVRLSLQLASVPRGERLMYSMLIENTDDDYLDDLMLSLPLSVGVDQLDVDVRTDGGGWTAYPANGLMPLESIPPHAQRIVEIRATVEAGAPAGLTAESTVLGPQEAPRRARRWNGSTCWRRTLRATGR